MHYDRTDINEGIGPAKSSGSKECMVCHYWCFNHGFQYQNSVCDGCLDLLIQCINISNIALINVKGADYCCTIHDISKSDAVSLLKSSVLDDCGYI